MLETLGCIVVGAGVIGLAIARRLAISGHEVVVLEKEMEVATHTSSRNSEVIHAGIYYPVVSLKARLCVAGRQSLYEYCDQKHVRYRKIGKYIVATSEKDVPRLLELRRRAVENGVTDLQLLTGQEISNNEPAVSCVAGLHSPSTGILDSHSYLLALQADLEAAGGSVICDSPVLQVRAMDGYFNVSVKSDQTFKVSCKYLINSAGLWASDVCANIDGGPDFDVPETLFAKAHYFGYTGKAPFSKLVYPLPHEDGLGIQATNDLAGTTRFGPDVSWVDSNDFTLEEGLKSKFATSIRSYFPELDVEKLNLAYTGIRPKIVGHGEPAGDFLIQREEHHGVHGLVNLFGIESPGLTASLVIADYVNDLLDRQPE